MTVKILDRAFETTTSVGTGAINLGGALSGYTSFALAGNGGKVFYEINDGDSSGLVTNWEIGIGTIATGSPNTLTRNTILSSSNSNNVVNFGNGTKNVLGAIAAKGLPTRDETLSFNEGFGLITGSANVLVFTPVSGVFPNAYSNGTPYTGFIATTNTTPGVTIQIGSLGVIAVKINGNDPGIGTLVAGQVLCGYYKQSTNTFELIAPVIPPVTLTKATTPEMQAGVEDTHYVTPAKVADAIAALTPPGVLGQKYYNCSNQSGITITIASPAVITMPGGVNAYRHTPNEGSIVVFTTTGVLPTGLLPNTPYFVVNIGPFPGNSFQVSLTKNGTPINTSGTQSGVHSTTNPPYIKANAVAGTKRVRVKMWGGPCYATNYWYGGGYCEKTYLLSDLSASEVFFVGQCDVGAGSLQNSTFKGMTAYGTTSTSGGQAVGGDINCMGSGYSYPGGYQVQNKPGGIIFEELP